MCYASDRACLSLIAPERTTGEPSVYAGGVAPNGGRNVFEFRLALDIVLDRQDLCLIKKYVTIYLTWVREGVNNLLLCVRLLPTRVGSRILSIPSSSSTPCPRIVANEFNLRFSLADAVPDSPANLISHICLNISSLFFLSPNRLNVISFIFPATSTLLPYFLLHVYGVYGKNKNKGHDWKPPISLMPHCRVIDARQRCTGVSVGKYKTYRKNRVTNHSDCVVNVRRRRNAKVLHRTIPGEKNVYGYT